jgi:hypothetical protein
MKSLKNQSAMPFSPYTKYIKVRNAPIKELTLRKRSLLGSLGVQNPELGGLETRERVERRLKTTSLEVSR